ncbi:uncharacterized protein [Henckelia pumila]|uniref:uncharacterized protein n=1 Tax=Henckelia pumila TaxID=405737 RepID=UPI003C6DE31C
MAAAEEVQLYLKVTMTKESCKVLFRPCLPIVRLLIKHYGEDAPILGSLSSLYAGLLNLDSSHFCTEKGKLLLLNPRNSSGHQCRRLKLKIDDTPPIQYFTCKNRTCVSIYYSVKCHCSNSNTELITKDLEIEAQSGEKSVFTVQTASCILTDDLQILTNSPASVFRILELNGIDDKNVVEGRKLIVGLKEIMDLLKESLVSKTLITDHIIRDKILGAATSNERKKYSASPKYVPVPPQTQTREHISLDSKKITVKAIVQKSTNRILVAQTWEDFADFLFSLLAIPLGRVQFLLGNNTCFYSIDNLYRSISSLEDLKYVKSRETMARILEPRIPPYNLSSYQIYSSTLAKNENDRPKRPRKFCERTHDIYGVTDDLVVSTPSSTSIVSILNKMEIPLSDVEERELDIGMEEALSILKASLTSTSALTDGLKPFLTRKPEEEK